MQLSIKMILFLLLALGAVLLADSVESSEYVALPILIVVMLYVSYRITKKAFLRAH